MSKMTADNLRAKTVGVEVPMVYPVRGSAKMWANLNGTGTIAVRDSLNVASLTDHGTGDYSHNLAAAMANANYATQVSSYDVNPFATISSTASAARVGVLNFGGSATDSLMVNTIVHGGLA